MTATSSAAVDGQALTTADDYLSLSVEERYGVVSQHFPDWLLADPIEFPAQHPTYGWACRVGDCEGAVAPTYTGLLCFWHAKLYSTAKESVGLEEFIATAEPIGAPRFGWALVREPECGLDVCSREARRRGYCYNHWESLARALKRGTSENDWCAHPHANLPPFEICCLPGCVHDGEFTAPVAGKHICRGHHRQRGYWLKKNSHADNGDTWNTWLASSPMVTNSLGDVGIRGRVSLAKLPASLQREIRYALHRHAHTARRSQWKPAAIQEAVNMLAAAGVRSLAHDDLSRMLPVARDKRYVKRVLADLPFAARSLVITEAIAKDSGWFDPMIVGATAFPGTQGGENRRKPWDLTAITQRWLRNLTWDYLRDHALMPAGKRPGVGTIHGRISGIVCLSYILRHHRDDHGQKPSALNAADARVVKEIWDMWSREQIPIPRMSDTPRDKPATLTAVNRVKYMCAIRAVLLHSRERQRTPAAMDSFILSLPEISRPKHGPRPRPLTYNDFQTLVSPESINRLEAADRDDVGLADIWLTQAFQGGRISETLKLRLGCIGLVGAAQPYLWRDITKSKVVDYGMPCYLPVYERLLLRQEKTRSRLRIRYAERLATMSPQDRERLEAQWDRTIPLFPGSNSNPDLILEVSQSFFRDVWTEWFKALGLTGLTTHQTRATLATSLLNNGAPAALVRQLLGHFSPEALAHYARYNDQSMTRHLRQVWAAGPGMDKPGTILLRPNELTATDPQAASARIDLTVVPVEHGLCRYGPVVGGNQCPFNKNCTTARSGPCEHFVLTGADLAYWERKRDAAYHFAEGAPTDEARDYILSQWHPWEPVIDGLREALAELGLLEEAEKLDLRAPVHDYFDPVFATGWSVAQLNPETVTSTPKPEN